MSFDTYNGPAPWKKKNNKKNPFDTNNTSINQDTSSFDTEKEKGIYQDTSVFDTNTQDNIKQNTSTFDTNFIKYNPNQKHFNPKGTLSNRHYEEKNQLQKELLEKRRKELKKRKIESDKIKKELEGEIKLEQEKKGEVQKIEIKDNNPFKKESIKEINKKALKEKMINDYKKDLLLKKEILLNDYNHNKKVEEIRNFIINNDVLKEKQEIKEEILKILNLKNGVKPISKNDYFIKYDKKEILSKNKSKKIIKLAMDLYSRKEDLNAKHCTDWIDKIYKKSFGISVYDSNTLFNGVKNINYGTGIGVKEYADEKYISNIMPGDHIIIDKESGGKYGVGKTHSILALSKSNNGLLKVISYPNYKSPPVIEYYDLYGKGRAKSGRPIRIQRIA